MPKLTINGIPVEAERGTTLLDAARFLGISIPTLCHDDGLTPVGACRLCVVEVKRGQQSKLLSACTLACEEGMVVHTHSGLVERTRRLLVELYVATCPSSKTIQDLASAMGVRQCRYEAEHETCIQCGLCVRMCREEMIAGAIGFAGRGKQRRVSRPFNMTDERCRQCGACLYICPVCDLRCAGPAVESTLCSGCLNFAPVCFESYDDAMCFLDPCHACELPGPFRHHVKLRANAPVQSQGEKP